MSSAVIMVNGQSVWRVTVRAMRASCGIGTGRVAFDLEVRPADELAFGMPLWLSASLVVRAPGLAGQHLCALSAMIEPTTVGGPLQDAVMTLQGSIDLRQLQVVEEARERGVSLELDLHGWTILERQYLPFWGVLLSHDVTQSDWVDYLSAWGYRNVLLLEIEQSAGGWSPAVRPAHEYLVQSQAHLLRHDYRSALESLRQCLSALVGQVEGADETETDVTNALKEAQKASRNGSDPATMSRRLEITRRALKFAADIGGHPESGEATRADAVAVFTMAAALLQRTR